jgi:hypothetical protein
VGCEVRLCISKLKETRIVLFFVEEEKERKRNSAA